MAKDVMSMMHREGTSPRPPLPSDFHRGGHSHAQDGGARQRWFYTYHRTQLEANLDLSLVLASLLYENPLQYLNSTCFVMQRTF